MKVAELLEATFSGRTRWRHKDDEHFGLRVEVSKEQRKEIEHQLGVMMRRRDGKTDQFSDQKLTIGYTSPEHASTFPCDIRLVIHNSDERYDKESLPGQMVQRLLKSAIRKVFHDVIGIGVEPTLEKDYHANNLRYVDMKVTWGSHEAR